MAFFDSIEKTEMQAEQVLGGDTTVETQTEEVEEATEAVRVCEPCSFTVPPLEPLDSPCPMILKTGVGLPECAAVFVAGVVVGYLFGKSITLSQQVCEDWGCEAE